jgi:hypothetical protein
VSHNESFEVLVTDFAPGDEPPAARLQRVFGIGPEAAQRLLARLPAPVQRNVPRVRAEYFRRALVKIGAVVEVRDADGALMEATPSVPPPASERPSYRAPDASADSNATWVDPSVERTQDTGDIKWLDAAPLAPVHGAPLDLLASVSAAAPMVGMPGSGTADTLVDARTPSEREQRAREPTLLQAATAPAGPFAQGLPVPAAASAPTLTTSGPPAASRAAYVRTEAAVPAPVIPFDNATLPDAVRAPAHPTVRDGVPVPETPASPGLGWGELRAPATPSYAPSATAAASAQPLDTTFDLLASDTRGQAASPLALPDLPLTSSFLPPPLELGLGPSDGLLSRMPSSVWDAPPPASPLHSFAPRRPPVEIDGPAHVPGSSLNALSAPDKRHAAATPPTKQSVGMLAPWELPPTTSMSEPAADASRRPASAKPNAGEPLPAVVNVARARNAEARAKHVAPNEASPRAEKRPRRRKPSKGEAVPSEKPPEPLASTWQSALGVPFAGLGLSWIAVLCAWACVAALLSVAAMIAVVPGALFTFVAMGTLLAIACEYFTACFKAEGAVTRMPDLSLERIWQGYVKGGAQLAVFALVVELPVILWSINALGEGATPLELLGTPTAWLLALPASYVWPAAIEQTIAQGHLGAVWNVPAALRRIASAPGAYSASAAIGALVFGLTLSLCVALASLLDVRGVMLLAAFGLPIALGHGVLGALLRHAR